MPDLIGEETREYFDSLRSKWTKATYVGFSISRDREKARMLARTLLAMLDDDMPSAFGGTDNCMDEIAIAEMLLGCLKDRHIAETYRDMLRERIGNRNEEEKEEP